MNKTATWYALVFTFLSVSIYGAFRDENIIEIIKLSGSVWLWLWLCKGENFLDNQ